MDEKLELRKIHIYVNRRKWDEFLQFVRENRGKVKGVLWEELDKALDCYMKGKSERREKEDYGFRKSKTLRIVDAIGDAVVSLFKQGKTVSLHGVEEWIRLNVSPNRNTIRQYMEYFRSIYVWDTWDGKYIKPWTFHRKDREPLWKSEDEYLRWLKERGISTAAIEQREEKEKEEIEALLNAEIAE